MTPEAIFILVTGAIAALLGVGALIGAMRPRPAPEATALPARTDRPADKYGADAEAGTAIAGTRGSAIRILWWVSIAAVLIGVGLSDAFDATRPAIYLVGAGAVLVVVLLRDVLPTRYRTAPVVAIEILAALGLTTVLLTLTGYAISPFAFGYSLVSVAVALALGGTLALGVAALSTLAYLLVLTQDPALSTYAGADLLRFGLTVGSIWLLAYLASAFASFHRRVLESTVELSRTDSLTGLFNRVQLFPTLEQEVQRTRRSERGFCLLMIDLDGLKAVNDTYGHARGDDVLRLLGSVIRRSIRSVDTAYRYGGDEFLVLLPETDFAGAFVVAEKIRAGAEEVGLSTGQGDVLTSVSIGLVSCPEDGTSTDELMLAADRAMYQAKSLGKNQVSGNPRPRRLLSRQLEEPEPSGTPPAAAAEAEAVVPVPMAMPEAAPEPVVIATAPVVATAPVAAPAAPAAPTPDELAAAAIRDATAAAPLPHESTDEDEPDASEVRRHIAAARQHMDPDHQIRRAMDAFLSPSRPNRD